MKSYKENLGVMIFKVIAAGAALYILILLYFFLNQSGFVYFPSSDISAVPSDAGVYYEDINIVTSDGERINAWYVPAPSSRGTVLFCHGNAGNISHRLDSVLILNSLGLDVLIFDYRGYGLSSGKPTEEGTRLDALAAYGYLVSEKKIAPERIIIFGRSLGGAVAARVALEKPAAALIIESSFTSINDLGAELYPLIPIRLLSRFGYNTRDYLSKVRIPVLVIHSPDDDVIPFSHGKKLYESAGKKGRFLEISGPHNRGFIISGEIYKEGLDNFMSSAGLDRVTEDI